MAITFDKTRVPVQFEETESLDSRFMKVKIFIAHTGENLNNSVFSKSTFEKMIPSLAGVPIVGYIHQNEDDETDFKGHEQEMVIEENGIRLRYKGHAYGFIPEDHNAQFEIRNGKEWITAEGVIWTKFDKAVDIFQNSNGIKSQSMEIINVDGSVDDAGRLVIDDAVFSGLCILGDDTPPAMTGSTVEVYSTENKDLKYQFSKEVEEMMTEFNKKGDGDLEKEKVEKTPEDEKFNEEVVEQDNPEETTDPEPENTGEGEEVKTEGTEDGTEFEDEENDSKDEPESDTGEKKEFETILDFKLSLQDINRKIYNALEDSLHDVVYILDTYEDEVVYEYVDFTDEGVKEGFEKVSYTKEGDSIVLGEVTELVLEFLTPQEKQAVEITRSMYEAVKAENEELKEFKYSIERKEKESKLEKFSNKLDKETVDKVREKLDSMSIEEIEKEIAYEVFKTNSMDEDSSVEVHNFGAGKSEVHSELGTLASFAH